MIYITVIILLLFLSLKYEILTNSTKINTKWFLLLFIIFVSIASLRDGLGIDTIQYENFFRKVPTIFNLDSSFFRTTRFRPGFVIFASICKSVINNIIFLQLVEALIVNGTIFYFIKKHSKFPYLTLLLYFLVNYLEFNMEIQREAISISLVLIAWSYWIKDKRILALLFFVTATTFHISCLIAILYPFANKIKFNKQWIITAVASIIIIPSVFFAIPNLSYYVSILLQSDSDNVISSYIVQEYNSSLNINAYSIHLIQFALVILCYTMLKKQNKDRFAGFVLIYMIFMYLSTISYGFYRLTNYYSLFYLLFIADFIVCLCKKNKFVSMAPALSCIIIFLYLTYYHESKLFIYDEMNNHYNYENYIPYRSIFNSI